MKTKNFNDLVKDYFSYLISDFGFSISEEVGVPENSLSRGMVLYVSGSKTMNAEIIQRFIENNNEEIQPVIRIILDRGYVFIDFGVTDLSPYDPISLIEIMQLVAPKVDLNEKVDYSKQPFEILEPQIRKLSHILRQYCTSFLQGDFSLIQRVVEKRNRAREDRIKEWKRKRE